MTVQDKLTLGSLMRSLRARYGLTLKEMSERIGVPFSTLAKVEHDRLTLTFDKLQTIGDRLGLRMSELLANSKDAPPAYANSRRSVATLASALPVKTPNYDHFYLSPELRQKDMIPIYTRLRARSLEEFGDMVRHNGQEFFYVLEGRVDVHTEFYDTVTLETGQAVYIDSRMGHAYLIADGCDQALVICVCSATQEELLDNAISQGPPRKPARALSPRPVKPAAPAPTPRVALRRSAKGASAAAAKRVPKSR